MNGKKYLIPCHRTVAKERIKALIYGMDDEEIEWVQEALNERVIKESAANPSFSSAQKE